MAYQNGSIATISYLAQLKNTPSPPPPPTVLSGCFILELALGSGYVVLTSYAKRSLKFYLDELQKAVQRIVWGILLSFSKAESADTLW